MSPRIDLTWPTVPDDDLLEQTHRVIHAVVAAGGAVGYVTPPGRADTDPFVREILADAAHGRAALALARVDGVVQAMGLWKRASAQVFAHSGEIGKVMAHPAARGLGLGRLVLAGLVDSARAAGLETLTLGARGNNHGAIELYEEMGFREWGRLPNVIEVGMERFDEVRMYLDLGTRDPRVVLRGSPPGGAGSSPRRRLRAGGRGEGHRNGHISQ
ncbi:GNAT family N-acetyltransferase [Sphaerisporangium rhizosphaerae]|uniref:GNAT family N-acetyltransferase n=1 Tax=Sphaerisporangium rhizosphaerae TaxID=2269375 RepID=A0ABW2P883_9ACTN